MSNNKNKIAILAGDGELPILLVNRLNELQCLSLLIILQGSRERFNFHQYKLVEIPPGEIRKILHVLTENKIYQVIMIGKIDKRGFIEREGFDAMAMKMLMQIKDGKDISIFHLILDELKKNGVEVLAQDKFLRDMIVDNGTHTNRKLTQNERTDVLFGMDHAKRFATMDVGQTVVVKNQSVLAVEAVEGTDETIRRGALLCQSYPIICKAARANQDRRFDIPVIGLNTLKLMSKHGCKVIAVEADNILIVNRDMVIEYANSNQISIVGIP